MEFPRRPFLGVGACLYCVGQGFSRLGVPELCFFLDLSHFRGKHGKSLECGVEFLFLLDLPHFKGKYGKMLDFRVEFCSWVGPGQIGLD